MKVILNTQNNDLNKKNLIKKFKQFKKKNNI